MTQEEDNINVNNPSDNPPDNTVKTELEILAEANAALQGYTPLHQTTHKYGFIEGFQACQKMLDDMQSKKFDIYFQGYSDGMRIHLNTSFTEQEIRDAYQNYDGSKGWFECADFLIKELKQIKLKQQDF